MVNITCAGIYLYGTCPCLRLKKVVDIVESFFGNPMAQINDFIFKEVALVKKLTTKIRQNTAKKKKFSLMEMFLNL
jgi:hypothetical protein